MIEKYDHKKIEAGKYEKWTCNGNYEQSIFKSDDQSEKKNFTIVLPPPNVTGNLHLGHAWDVTLQDIIVRYKKAQGFNTLWVPGMDHAGIATQAKVEEKMAESGISRHDIGREEFLKLAWEWKDEYAQNIRTQWSKMAISLDYSKERFTLDKGFSKLVEETFIKMAQNGYIYRGKRIINWDVKAQTALSDIEVVHKEINGAMYSLKYKLVDSDDYIVIATTRPETIFADQAIIVHPEDERYKNLIGKKAIIPGTKIEIPIIADDYVEMDFGSGAMKVTPYHDINDFEIGNRHDLKVISCMNLDGTMNDLAVGYKGMDRFECRKKLIEDLQKNGLVYAIEEHLHNVGHSERTGVVVEQIVSEQWFVKMEELARMSIEKNADLNFVPERFRKTFLNWMNDCHDWCISRQLWWGHQIPAWYKDGETKIQSESPGEDWVRDEDVLDTWFSSALWPFGVFSYDAEGNPTPELEERYFPTQTLVTGYDIIFFWVSRMIFQSLNEKGVMPFDDVLIHGLIRDSQGRKMSKSLGNGIDPMEVIDQYGVDNLGWFLASTSSPGEDLRYDEEKIIAARNFSNKIFNAAKFIKMNNDKHNFDYEIFSNSIIHDINSIDDWITQKYNKMLSKYITQMDRYEFGIAAKELYSFVWNDFCNWYIELSKEELNNDDASKFTLFTMNKMFDKILILLNPFMPNLAEELYQSIHPQINSINKRSIDKNFDRILGLDVNVKKIDFTIHIIEQLRKMQAEYKIKKDNKYNIFIEKNQMQLIQEELIRKDKKIYVDQIEIDSNFSFKEDMITIPLEGGVLHVPLEGLVNMEEEIKRLEVEHEKLQKEIQRSNGILGNEKFMNSAKPEKIASEQEKLENYQTQLAIIEEKLKSAKA